MLAVGCPHCGVLAMLVAWARIWSFQRSVMGKVRNADASRFQYPGPLRKFGPKFPNSGNPPFSAPGCAKHWLVTRGPLAELKLQIVFWNQGLPGPVPCRIGIGPGPNQFRVLLLFGEL